MYNVTLIPGDGIGPEVSKSMVRVVEATGIDINWEIVNAGLNVIEEYNTPLPDHVIESIKKNKIAIKGPITTPVGKGFKSVNVTLRQALDLYVNLRPIKTFKGIKSRYENVDLVIVRENTEDLYAGIEHKLGDYGAESIKIITKAACERIVEFACDYVKENNRKKLTGVHKANIMKLTDGLFLKVFRDISEKNKIDYDDLIVDAETMNLLLKPEAVHGSAPDIAGTNKANPTALIQSAIMMLRYLGEHNAAKKIERALEKVFIEGRVLTVDLGGNATTDEFTEELCKYVLEGVKAY